MNAETEAIVLDPIRDGVEQISEALAGRENLASIHVISHGEPNRVFLGNGALDVVSAATTYSEALAGWQKALAPGADLLLYGCNVGAGPGGSLPQVLAHLTGADVVASEDLTGAARLGGDWDLEVQTGPIEARLIVSEIVRAEYAHVLASLVSTLASSTNDFADGTGTAAQFNYPVGITADGAGNLYVTEKAPRGYRHQTFGAARSPPVHGVLSRIMAELQHTDRCFYELFYPCFLASVRVFAPLIMD